MSHIVEMTGVPCARYEGGENDGRVSAVFAYALGLIGADVSKIKDHVARVYDYKGDLVLATRKPLPAAWEDAFRRAWEQVGREVAGNVYFPPVTSAEWDRYWRGRRFDSDWRP